MIELFPFPYPPKVQARPPRDQRPATRSRVSGQGYGDMTKYDIYKAVHINFIGNILSVKKATPLFVMYGELGRILIELIVQRRLVSFWARILLNV